MQSNSQSFIRCFPHYVEELHTECVVYNYRGEKAPFMALWDTGASHSLITRKVVEALNLQVADFAELYHAGGSSTTGCYNVFLQLPNEIVIGPLQVIEGQIDGADVLIGMDIIGSGDLVVTNNSGHTEMAFAIPSSLKIDNIINAVNKK